jgi:hypothetical protein
LEKPLPKDYCAEEEMTALEKHTGFHWQIDPNERMFFQMGYWNTDRIPTNYRELIEATCFAGDLDYCIEPGKIHIGTRDTIAATGLRRNPPIQ